MTSTKLKLRQGNNQRVTSGKRNGSYDLLHPNLISISKRQGNHDTFAESLINPKHITSRVLSHGKKLESVALMQYHKVMHKRRTPVQVLPCDFVISKEYPILGVSPDARVVDPGCTDHFGLAEVKCPYTKFHVFP